MNGRPCIVVPAADWTTLWDHWLENTDDLVKVYRPNSTLIFSPRLGRIAKARTSVLQHCQEIGISPETSWKIAMVSAQGLEIECLTEEQAIKETACAPPNCSR